MQIIESKDELVENNLGLVGDIAKRYLGRGLDFDDLFQEGCVGLIKAAKRFEPQQGNKFGTYATWWVRQAINQALAEQSRLVRVPDYMHKKVGKMNYIQAGLCQELGRDPSSEEIADEMGIDVEEVEKIMQANAGILSFETPIGSSEEASLLGDALGAEDDDMVVAQEIRELVQFELTEDEERVLFLSLGFDLAIDDVLKKNPKQRHGYTDDEIVKELHKEYGKNVTRTWVSKTRKEARRKLEQSEYLKQLC